MQDPPQVGIVATWGWEDLCPVGDAVVLAAQEKGRTTSKTPSAMKTFSPFPAFATAMFVLIAMTSCTKDRAEDLAPLGSNTMGMPKPMPEAPGTPAMPLDEMARPQADAAGQAVSGEAHIGKEQVAVRPEVSWIPAGSPASGPSISDIKVEDTGVALPGSKKIRFDGPRDR